MRIYSEGCLPEKHDALIADMEKWCLQTWGFKPGWSTLSQKIKPYYDALEEQPRRSA